MLVSREFAVGPNMNHLGQEFSSGKNNIMFPTNYKMILYSWNENICIYLHNYTQKAAYKVYYKYN